jgi:hypothetical protein
MDAAYDAVFFCALAVRTSQAVRVTSRPGHHAVALEAAATVMKLQEWRNRKYQGFFSANERDVADAIETARKYLEATSAWVKREQAQLLK